MKKRLPLFLASLLLAGTLSACGGSGGTAGSSAKGTDVANADGSAATANAGEVEVSAPGELPIVKETVSLSFFIVQNTNVESYEDNKFTRFMEEKTGVKLDFRTVPEQDATQKVNLLLASNTDLPDVFMGPYVLTSDIVADMAEQGVFIPLDEMIENDGFYYKEVLEKEPLLESMMKLPDGKQYTLAKVVKSIPNESSARGWINQVWLDNLGLETPTTTDEFYEVLKAFKEKDPNGNGKADEIPMIGASVTGWKTSPEEWLLNSFVKFNRDSPYYIDDDNKIQAAYDKDAYRKGMIFMNKLTTEGLLDSATFTQDGDQLKQIFANEDCALVGFVPGGGTFIFAPMTGERVREYVPLAPLKGPDGVQYSYNNPYGSYAPVEFAITSACKNPRVAFKFADYMSSREASMFNRLGEPEVDYLIPANGEMGVDDQPASYIPVLQWGSIQKSHWNEIGPSYNDFDNNGVKSDDPYELQQYLWNATRDYYTPYVPDPKYSYNFSTFYTSEDARRLADVWSTLKDYGREHVAKFSTGVLDPNDDKVWNNYLSELKNIGYEESLSIMQARLDELNAQ